MSRVPNSGRFAAIALAALFACQAAMAGGPRPVHRRDARAEVEKTDQLWRDAQASNDTTAMERLLSDDYLGITGNGQVVTKQLQLDRMKSRQMDIRRLDISDVNVKLKGPVAIVTSTADLEGTIDGRPVKGMFRSTRIYQRLPSGAWQLTNFEATPLRPGGGGGHGVQQLAPQAQVPSAVPTQSATQQ